MQPQPSAEAKEEELARFREEWRQEVSRRKAETEAKKAADRTERGAGPASASSSSAGIKVPSQAFTFQASPSTQQTVSRHPSSVARSSALPKSLVSALDVYRQAIIHEQGGLFDEATSPERCGDFRR